MIHPNGEESEDAGGIGGAGARDAGVEPAGGLRRPEQVAGHQRAFQGPEQVVGTSGLSKGVMGCNILGKCDAGDKTGLAKVFNFNFGHG